MGKTTVIEAIQNTDSWAVSAAEHFQIEFYFTCEKDFLTHKLPGYQQLPVAKQQEIKDFLHLHRIENGIVLKSDRYLNLLKRKRTV